VALAIATIMLVPAGGRAQTTVPADPGEAAAAAEAGAIDGQAPQRTPSPRRPAAEMRAWAPFPTTTALPAPVSHDPALELAANKAPPFLVKLGAEVKESWTDNVYLAAHRRTADAITTLTPSLSVSDRTRHLDLGLDYRPSYDRYAVSDDQSGFRQSGLGVLTAELLEDTVFVDLRGSVSEQATNPSEASANGLRASTINTTRVMTGSITPRVRQRLGDLAVAQIVLGHDTTMNTTPTPTAESGASAGPRLNNTTSDRARIEARSGDYFSRTLWDVSSNVVHSSQSGGGGDLTQSTQNLGLEYRLTQEVGLLGSFGYDSIHGQGVDADKIGGLFTLGGLRWTPSPDTDMRGGLGWRYGQQNVFALLDHRIGPRTTLRVKHDVGVFSDALTQFDLLNAVQRDDMGNFVNPFSGLAADPGAQSISRSNATTRQETSSLVLRRSGVLDTVSLTGTLTQQEVLSQSLRADTAPKGSSSSVVSAVLSWAHQLSERAASTAQARYSDTLKASGSNAKSSLVGVNLGLSYALTATLSAGVAYDFLFTSKDAIQTSIFSSTQTGDVSVNTISFSLKKSF